VQGFESRPRVLLRWDLEQFYTRKVTALHQINDILSDLASCRALRSTARGELLVRRARSALKQRRTFSVIGPSTWNELPLTLRLLPRNNVSSVCSAS